MLLTMVPPKACQAILQNQRTERRDHEDLVAFLGLWVSLAWLVVKGYLECARHETAAFTPLYCAKRWDWSRGP